MGIGERIKLVRKENHLTQEQLAHNLGVHLSHISHVERGTREPSEQLIKSIVLLFGLREEWLKTGDGEMFISPEESLKNLMARHGEQAIIDAFRSIQASKEASTEIKDVTGYTRRAYDKEPELKRMVDALHIIFSASDDKLKNWASVQFNRAFPDDVIEDVQKKQKVHHGQASAG